MVVLVEKMVTFGCTIAIVVRPRRSNSGLAEIHEPQVVSEERRNSVGTARASLSA